MEIPIEIVLKALALIETSGSDIQLDFILKELEAYTVKDFFNRNENKGLTEIIQRIDRVLRPIHYNNKNEEDKVVELARLISSAKTYLINGILNADLASIIIFILINSHLKIPIDFLLSTEQLDEKALSEKILNHFSTIKFEIKIFDKVPFHELKLITESQEGIVKGNIELVYNLIQAIERSGRGFHFDFITENLLNFFFQFSYTSFIELISKTIHPHSLVLYLIGFSKDRLLRISNESLIENKWLCFELIRGIISSEKEEQIEPADCNAVKQLLSKIYTEDFEFYKQTIKYFHRSFIFNAALGEFLTSLPDNQIIDTIDTIDLDKYSFHIGQRNCLFRHFSIKATEDQEKVLVIKTFEKWENYLSSVSQESDFYQNSILITDFGDFIVKYYILINTDDEITSQILLLISAIRHIDSEWSISQSHQLTQVHLYLSCLYLLSYAYKDRKIESATLMDSFKLLKLNKIFILRFFSEEDMKGIDIIFQNLSVNLNQSSDSHISN